MPNSSGDIFARRLLFVTGKGGVGKTTVAAALGVVAAGAGLRTLVCELAEQERLAALFGHADTGFAEAEVAPDLFAITIDPSRAMEEYMRLQIKLGPLSDLLFKNRIFETLAAATPGLRELLTIGKVWELAQVERLTRGAGRYDLVIVDAPATGHGIALLEAPNTFRDMARVGPIHSQAGRIAGFLHDPALTALIAVATAEEMPVNETAGLSATLDGRLGLDLSAVIVNAVRRSPISDAESDLLATRDGSNPMVAAALAEHARAAAQATQLRRLRRAIKQPIVELPFIFDRNFGRQAVGELAETIEAAFAPSGAAAR